MWKMRIVEKFISDLADKESDEFKNLSRKLEKDLVAILKDVDGFWDARVDDFAHGSIICFFRIFVNGSSDATEYSVEDILQEAVRNNRFNGLEVEHIILANTKKSSENQKEFEAVILFDGMYTYELGDESSKRFRTLAIKVERSLDSLYRQTIRGYLYVKVRSFSNGSIICDVRIVVEKLSNVTDKELKHTLEQNKDKVFNDTRHMVEGVAVAEIKTEPTESLMKFEDQSGWLFWKTAAIAAGTMVFLVGVVGVILCCRVGSFVTFL